VADQCRHCGNVTQFQLVQYYKVQHVYFIPMGSGSLINSELKCTKCGTLSSTSFEDYLGVVPSKRAPSLSLGEVVDETNPRLAKLVATLAQFEKENGANPSQVSPSQTRIQDACKKLWELGPHHPALNILLPRLNRWSRLSGVNRDRLWREIDALHEESALRERRRMFLHALAKDFKPDVDAFLSVLTLLLVTAAGTIGSVVLMNVLMLDPGWCLVGIVASVVAGFACLMLIQRWRRRRGHRQFFRAILLPKASSLGIDLARFAEELRGYRLGESELDKKIQAMAQALPVLEETLREMGMPLEPPPAGEPPCEIAENPEDPMLFLLTIGKNFKPKRDDLPPVLAGLITAGLLFTTAVIWLEKVATLPKLLMVLLGGGGGILWTHRLLERRRHRRFFSKALVPEALRRGVNLKEVVEVLAAIRAKDLAPEHPLHSLARSWQILDAMVCQGSDECQNPAGAKR
jgi:hypothetical protein